MYIKEAVESTIVIEKSKFITYLRPCFDLDDYRDFLKEIKKKHYDATHVCSAFISDSQKRSSDDGEPSGTAGVPILSTLEKANINHTAALVVRYFGGIKLGAGGLVRAYSSSVSEAIKKAKIVEDVEVKKYILNLSYELANKVDYLINKSGDILNVEYEERVTYTYLSNDDSLIEKIQEVTSGVSPECIGIELVQKEVK